MQIAIYVPFSGDSIIANSSGSIAILHGRNMSIWLALVFSFVSYVVSQAPGDRDLRCTGLFLGRQLFVLQLYTNRYADNERPLMDSRDYVTLLHEVGGAWQQVDNDNNNSVEVVTEVSDL